MVHVLPTLDTASFRNLTSHKVHRGPRFGAFQEEPQQLPGTQPLLDGLPPQHVDPPTWPPLLLITGGAGAESRSCNSELPHDRQAISSELRPIPTSSSLIEPQSPHKYSLIGMISFLSGLIGVNHLVMIPGGQIVQCFRFLSILNALDPILLSSVL